MIDVSEIDREERDLLRAALVAVVPCEPDRCGGAPLAMCEECMFLPARLALDATSAGRKAAEKLLTATVAERVGILEQNLRRDARGELPAGWVDPDYDL